MKPKIGIDIIENQRIKLETSFLQKFLSDNELAMLNDFPLQERKIEFCGGRWAAKEAIFKVMDPKKRIPINQIDIGYSPEGDLQIMNPELANVSVSISHEKQYSVATALKWGD